ncbi:hypothetical protein RD110_19215 [Rhodoferax koreense]|uniref:histidine kinase n=1 Tax=Rhodoferax koreensis TaxID=1842727 RepID=A0A1P8K459_9BURK|nr:hypothetical protein RD110_19215 [Rhodoferax koreense]
MRRSLPRSLFGRLALLLVAAVLVGQVLAMALMFELRPFPARPPEAGVFAGDRLPVMPAQIGPASPRAGIPPRSAAGAFPPSLSPPPPPRPPPPEFPLMHGGLLLDIAVRVAALLLAAWVGARWLSEPIRRLARAARALGDDIEGPPLAENGSTEAREASRLFNQMQARIREQLNERDRLVAAVSHDLRTPLTRLRLRAENLADPERKRQFAQDISEMDNMIRTTLDVLSGAADAEPRVLLDVVALLDSMADDLRDAGHAVAVHGTAAPIRAQPQSLQRCISNLLENAIRYGGCAEVRLDDAHDTLRIAICDRGPGLPPEELDRVMAPFYRLQASRQLNQGGVGLGLSIALDIARRHGGTLTLANREAGGLVATLDLPRVLSKV